MTCSRVNFTFTFALYLMMGDRALTVLFLAHIQYVLLMYR